MLRNRNMGSSNNKEMNNSISNLTATTTTSSLSISSHQGSSDNGEPYTNNNSNNSSAKQIIRPTLSFYQQARSPKAILSSIYNDFSLHLLRDLSICYSVFYFGVHYAKYYMRINGYQNFRPIPHQVTKAGDILLDLSLTNELIDKPDQTFNSPRLRFISLQLPLMIVVFLGAVFPLATNIPKNNSFANMSAGICTVLFAWGISELWTNIFKYYVGRLRPNFYEMCAFDKETLQCTADEHRIMSSRQSFPSGHSSRSFCGLLCVVLILLGRIGLGRNIGSVRASSRGKMLLLMSCTPLLLAFWCATSRLVDNWHHPGDIIAGTILGSICALISYHMFFPHIFSEHAGIPLSVIRSAEEGHEKSYDYMPVEKAQRQESV